MADRFDYRFEVVEKRELEGRVFGWDYVCRKNGETLVDHSERIFLPEDLEPAVYAALGEIVAADMHEPDTKGRSYWETVCVGVVSGERPMFSVGGFAEPVEAEIDV